MIEKVMDISLACDESLYLQKQRLLPLKEEEYAHRVAIVTGIHGDELEGQYTCYRLIQTIRASLKDLHCIVDVYPSVNPLGMDSIERGIPLYDLDMNRTFPGNPSGTMSEYVASKLVEDVEGADLALDIHASNIFLREAPQVRINTMVKENLVPLARELDVDLVWVHPNATVLESTFAYTMNSRNVPTLVVELGVGMRITKAYGERLTNGILNLLHTLGYWTGSVQPVHVPLVSEDPEEVAYINAGKSGVFVPSVEHGVMLQKGEHVGDIISPLSGEVLEKIESPFDGWLFTLREYPMVYEGALIARILRGSNHA